MSSKFIPSWSCVFFDRISTHSRKSHKSKCSGCAFGLNRGTIDVKHDLFLRCTYNIFGSTRVLQILTFLLEVYSAQRRWWLYGRQSLRWPGDRLLCLGIALVMIRASSKRLSAFSMLGSVRPDHSVSIIVDHLCVNYQSDDHDGPDRAIHAGHWVYGT